MNRLKMEPVQVNRVPGREPVAWLGIGNRNADPEIIPINGIEIHPVIEMDLGEGKPIARPAISLYRGDSDVAATVVIDPKSVDFVVERLRVRSNEIKRMNNL